jgi:hypothetical protein
MTKTHFSINEPRKSLLHSIGDLNYKSSIFYVLHILMNKVLNKLNFLFTIKLCFHSIFVNVNILMLIQLHLNLKNQYKIMMMFSMIHISMSLIGFEEHLFHNSIIYYYQHEYHIKI